MYRRERDLLLAWALCVSVCDIYKGFARIEALKLLRFGASRAFLLSDWRLVVGIILSPFILVAP